MGVVLFLVLTGYLVTCSLQRRWKQSGSVNYLHFLGHRLARIWPPMAAAVLVTVTLCVAFNHVLLTKLKPDLVPSLLLCSNLASILRGASYFDNLGGTSPLTHLWYLGVDAQFCLVWPLVFTALQHVRSPRARRIATLVLAAASAVAMAVLYVPNADPTRVYYGPDTRAFAPLLGAWLAMGWPLGAPRPRRFFRLMPYPTPGRCATVGAVGLVGLLAIMLFVPATSTFLYGGGMLLAAICSVALIAGVLQAESPLARVLGCRPLAWLGGRAYGIYLWHFPLFQLVGATNGSTPIWVVLLAVVGSVALAEVSLRLIEQPIARGDVQAKLADLRSADADSQYYARRRATAPAAVAAALAVVAVVGCVAVPDATALPSDALNNTGVSAGQAANLTAGGNNVPAGGDTGGSAVIGSAANAPKTDATSQAPTASPDKPLILKASSDETSQNKYDPFIVADSVAGDASWYFERTCPNGYLDSYVGRQPFQALDVLRDYINQGVVGNVVVLTCFSNDGPYEDIYEDMVTACGDREVYLVNVHVPDRFQDDVNTSLEKVAQKHDNVHIIDWYSAVADHVDEWLYDDDEHLTPQGQPHYIDLINTSIHDDFVANGGSAEQGEESLRQE